MKTNQQLPAGHCACPAALLAMVFGWRKKPGRYNTLIMLLVLNAVMGVGLAAAGNGSTAPCTPSLPPSLHRPRFLYQLLG